MVWDGAEVGCIIEPMVSPGDEDAVPKFAGGYVILPAAPLVEVLRDPNRVATALLLLGMGRI